MLMGILLITAFTFTATAQDGDEIISIYEGSRVIHDDVIGFESYDLVDSDSTFHTLEGNLRRRFCIAPDGRSPYEILRNYQSAIENMGGTILYTTREPRSATIEETPLPDYFFQQRIGHNRNYAYMRFTRQLGDFLSARIPTPEVDVYVALMTGRADNTTVFDLFTMQTELMDMGMVTTDILADGIAMHGRVAVYDIFFDTGQSGVKEASMEALGVIADFMNQHPSSGYMVVGHTDNVGGYDMNLRLSEDRARAVVEILINRFGIDEGQLRPVGVGPVSALSANTSEAGRAKNRRVEIVAE